MATRDRTKAFGDEKLRAAFDFFDKDGSGTIDKAKLDAVMCDKEEVDQDMWDVILQEVDEDGDGVINFAEFKKMMVRLVEIKEPRYTMELPKVNYSNLQDVSNFRSSFLGMK